MYTVKTVNVGCRTFVDRVEDNSNTVLINHCEISI